MTIAIFLSSLIAAMMIGVPISFSLLLCGAALMWHLNMFDAQILAQNLIEGANSFPLLAVPFFMLAGEIMNAGGLSKRIVAFAMALVGHVRGGLGYVAIMAAVIMASLSGSAVADAAALAALLLPMMHTAGHDKARSAGLMAARTHRWRADHQLLSCARWVGRTHTPRSRARVSNSVRMACAAPWRRWRALVRMDLSSPCPPSVAVVGVSSLRAPMASSSPSSPGWASAGRRQAVRKVISGRRRPFRSSANTHSGGEAARMPARCSSSRLSTCGFVSSRSTRM